jgi:protein disulfide-isomerase
MNKNSLSPSKNFWKKRQKFQRVAETLFADFKINFMKKFAVCLLTCFAVLQLKAADLAWMTDLPKAQAKAKAENKLVMMDFTGSDWCIWCKRLNKEVFSTPEFADYAKKNLVLMEVDFPQSKPQSAALKKANEALQEKYRIEGYPTIVVLNGDGKKVGELGYMKGGPKAFIAELEKLKKS